MLNEVIQKKMEELPSHIRRAIENFDWATEVMHIARNNKMQFDDIDIFKKEILMVMIGLTSADDFEKNLVNQLGISHGFAEKLVDDANEFIFIPLQKMAFSHEINEENEEIRHEEISKILNDNGIELVEEEREFPKNELQELADSLFSAPKKETQPQKTREEHSLKETNKKTYEEPIEEEDLLGITGDHINTDILHKKDKTINSIPQKEDSLKHALEKKRLEKTHISRLEKFDFSPSREKQLSERGDFLKHIGAK